MQCFEKEDCWNFIEHNGWVKRLFEEALTHSKTRKPGMPKDLVNQPAVFVLEYSDGLRAAAFLMTAWLRISPSPSTSKAGPSQSQR